MYQSSNATSKKTLATWKVGNNRKSRNLMTQIIAPNTTKPNHKKNNAIRKWQKLMDKTNEKHMSS